MLHEWQAFWCNFLTKSAKRRREIFLLNSGIPEISPGGVQNEKIQNPQTLPESRSGRTFLEKIFLAPLDFYFTRTAAKSVSQLSRSLHEVQTTHYLNVA